MITDTIIQQTMEKYISFLRATGKSKSTIEVYSYHTKEYMVWQKKNETRVSKLECGKRMELYLTERANDKKRPISFQTQKLIFNALHNFYAEFKKIEIGKINSVRAPHRQRIFRVPTCEQVRILLNALPDPYNLPGKMLYGSGMRIEECLALRVKDLIFENHKISVQEGKGDKPRLVDMPISLIEPLKKQLELNRHIYNADRTRGRPGVAMPGGMNTKNPSLSISWEWFWVFPHHQEGKDPETGIIRRHHLYQFNFQKVIRNVRIKNKLPVYMTAHSLRHAYATHYLQNLLKKMKNCGIDIPDIYSFLRDSLRKKLGHVSSDTTDLYIHFAMDNDDITCESPLDVL